MIHNTLSCRVPHILRFMGSFFLNTNYSSGAFELSRHWFGQEDAKTAWCTSDDSLNEEREHNLA